MKQAERKSVKVWLVMNTADLSVMMNALHGAQFLMTSRGESQRQFA